MARLKRNLTASIVALLCVVQTHLSTVAQNEYFTGREFSKARNAVIGVSWKQAPLRETLHNLAGRQHVAIFLDRRVDPTQLIEFTSRGRTVEQTIMELTDQLGLGALKVDDSFFYVGPRDKIGELEVRRKRLMKQVRNLSSAKHRIAWQSGKTLDIELLGEPARAYQELANSPDVRILSGDEVGHDLWPEISLPNITLIDRMIVLSYGFGLWVEVSKDGTAARLIVPKEMEPYSVTHRGKISPENERQLLEEYPSIEISPNKTTTKVVATPAVHYEVRRMLNAVSSSNRRAPNSDVRLSLSTGDKGARIVAILKNVAENRGVELKYDSGLKSALETRVNFESKQVTPEELIRKALETTGLKFELTDQYLLITK